LMTFSRLCFVNLVSFPRVTHRASSRTDLSPRVFATSSVRPSVVRRDVVSRRLSDSFFKKISKLLAPHVFGTYWVSAPRV